MTISLHAAFVPSASQILTALGGLLGKASTHCADGGIAPATLIGARLIEDMLPFGYQVKAVVGHTVGAIDGVRAGVFSPDRSGWPEELGAYQAMVADAVAKLDAIDPAEMDGLVGRPMRFAMGERTMDFTADQFLLSFSQPNFYFHATTAYDILRSQGLPLGKRDYLGVPRLVG